MGKIGGKVLMLCCILAVLTLAPAGSALAYTHSAAVTYADRWANSFNPVYLHWEADGNGSSTSSLVPFLNPSVSIKIGEGYDPNSWPSGSLVDAHTRARYHVDPAN
jgi:hypothetical protein